MANREREESRALLVPSDPQATPELRETREFQDLSGSLGRGAPLGREVLLAPRGYRASLVLSVSRALWG